MTKADRTLLILAVFILFLMTAVHTVAVLQTMDTNNTLIEEAELLREEMDDTQRIVDNARDISEASVDFWRCAFLIEPDVEKTPDVIEECIDAAGFPARIKEGG